MADVAMTVATSKAKRPCAELRQHKLVMSFDVEMTGDYCGQDDMLAFGAAAGYYDEGTRQVKTVYRALVVRALKRPDWTWERLWREHEYEQRCYDEFWAKNLTVLEWYDEVCDRDDLTHVRKSIPHPGLGTDEPMEGHEPVAVNYKRGRLEDGAKLFIVDTQCDMAFCIDHVLRKMEKRSAGFKCVQVADVIDFDAVHVNYLLGQFGFPSTLYTRMREDEETHKRIGPRYMGDRYEIDSVILGITHANLLAKHFDYDRDVTPYKRWLQAKLTVQNDHQAHNDAEHKVGLFLLAQYELTEAMRNATLKVIATPKDGNLLNNESRNLQYEAVVVPRQCCAH